MLASSDFDRHKHGGLSANGGSFNDEVLWTSFKKGNELALSLIYKKYVHRLYNYGMHNYHDHEMVLDCLQELFMRLWNKRETISNIQAVKPYLFKSFRRLLINQSIANRKQSQRVPEGAIAFAFEPSIESTLIEDELKAEQTERLKHCVQSLTKGQREIIFLKFFNGLSYHEIAEITEMQVDSVYNLVSRTIELLRKKLQITRPLVPLH